jgi:hypothetical protein
MEVFVLEEFERFTLIYEEKYFGGIWIGVFLGFWARVHVRLLRRGDHCCANLCVWGNLSEELPGKCRLG